MNVETTLYSIYRARTRGDKRKQIDIQKRPFFVYAKFSSCLLLFAVNLPGKCNGKFIIKKVSVNYEKFKKQLFKNFNKFLPFFLKFLQFAQNLNYFI